MKNKMGRVRVQNIHAEKKKNSVPWRPERASQPTCLLRSGRGDAWRLGYSRRPGHPCSDDSWNPVRANLHLQACERKQLLRIRFQTDSKHPVHGNIHCPLQRPRKKALKQTQCSQLIAWSSPLSSFSSTNQTVNGVCSFQTACDFFFPATVVSELSLVP